MSYGIKLVVDNPKVPIEQVDTTTAKRPSLYNVFGYLEPAWHEAWTPGRSLAEDHLEAVKLHEAYHYVSHAQGIREADSEVPSCLAQIAYAKDPWFELTYFGLSVFTTDDDGKVLPIPIRNDAGKITGYTTQTKHGFAEMIFFSLMANEMGLIPQGKNLTDFYADHPQAFDTVLRKVIIEISAMSQEELQQKAEEYLKLYVEV